MLALQGVGFALFSSPNMTLIMNSVPPTAIGMASALGAKARALGMVCGMLIPSVLISLELGDEPLAEHPDRLVGIMVATFCLLCVSTSAALLGTLLTRTRRAEDG